jgi:hypothetical protein
MNDHDHGDNNSIEITGQMDDTSTSSASKVRGGKGMYVGTCDTSDAKHDKGPLGGKWGEGPLQSSHLDASFPNIGQVNSISKKRPDDRAKASDARDAEGKDGSSDACLIPKTGLKKEKETRGVGIDLKNQKNPKGVKHTKETNLLNKTVGATSNKKCKSYFKASSFEKDWPLTGKGCPHSLLLHIGDNGQQALGAPKINSQLGRVIYNLSETDRKYIRWFIKI